MKKLHVTDLTDAEFTAVFQAAAKDAVNRARIRGDDIPSAAWVAGKPEAKREKAAGGRTTRKKAVA